MFWIRNEIFRIRIKLRVFRNPDPTHDIQENWEMKKKLIINQKGPEVSTNYLQFSIFILKFNTGIRAHRQSTARNIEEKT